MQKSLSPYIAIGAAAAIAAFSAQPAAAAVTMQAVFTGTVRSAIGVSFPGDAPPPRFTLAVTYDPALGGVFSGGPGIEGRSGFNGTADSPFLSLMFRVEGTPQFDVLVDHPNSLASLANYAASYNAAFGTQGFFAASATHYQRDALAQIVSQVRFDLAVFAPAGDHLTSPFDGDAVRGPYGNVIAFEDYQPERHGWELGLDTGHLSVSRLTGPGGVPEPSQWALLVLGLGLTGAAMRRRGGPATEGLGRRGSQAEGLSTASSTWPEPLAMRPS